MISVADILNSLAQERAVIEGAPVSFGVALAVIVSALGGLIWWAVRWRYSGQIDNLRTQIGALKERLGLANDRFNEAQAARERLEAKLEELREESEAGATAEVIADTTAAATEALADLKRAESDIGSLLIWKKQ